LAEFKVGVENVIFSVDSPHNLLMVTYSPIAFNLLPKQFTLNELFQFYCTILGADFTDYSNFRARLLKLIKARISSGYGGEGVPGGGTRPAALYRFDADAFLPFKDKPLVFV
jgi:8-oxo-dGTP diphosphatase